MSRMTIRQLVQALQALPNQDLPVMVGSSDVYPGFRLEEFKLLDDGSEDHDHVVGETCLSITPAS